MTCAASSLAAMPGWQTNPRLTNMKSKTPRSDALLMNLKVTPEYTKEKDTDRDRALYLCRQLEAENAELKIAVMEAVPLLKHYENQLASSLSCDSRSHDGDREYRRQLNAILKAAVNLQPSDESANIRS